MLSRGWLCFQKAADSVGGEIVPYNKDRISAGGVILSAGVGGPNTLSLAGINSGISVTKQSVVGSVAANKVFKFADVHGLIKYPFFIQGPIAIQPSAFVTEVECYCGDHWDCGDCDEMIQYTYRSTTFTQGAFGTNQRIMAANPQRVSFGLSSPASANPASAFKLMTTNDNNLNWFVSNFPFNQVFPYRDWGPLIRSDIWWNASVAGDTVVVTEIIKL
jgi:hypothetical protein